MRKPGIRNIGLFILHVFAALADAKELDGSQNAGVSSNRGGTLMDRALRLSVRSCAELDHTTLGKVGNLAVQPRSALALETPVRAQSQLMRSRPMTSNMIYGSMNMHKPLYHSLVHSGNAKSALVAKATETSNKAMPYNEVDEAAMIKAAGFPISPEKLISRTKEILRMDLSQAPTALADDFQFIGPVVGPLKKEAFLKAIGGFQLPVAFPDLKNYYYGFRVDPFEPNRVWFDSRMSGTHTGILAGSIQPTGKEVECPPQALSYTFNEDGQVKKITVGVVMDRTVGNTGGLGGIFALFYAVGSPLPFPEAKPWKKSKRYKFFNWLGPMLQKLQKKPEPKEA